MTSVRSAKSKGSSFEYSCRDSLRQIMPDILLTKQLGFVSGYDLVSHDQKKVFECKRHRAFSWNELKKTFLKLEKNAPPSYSSFLLFQANHQPCLVMFVSQQYAGMLCVASFDVYYNAPFIKHVGEKKQARVVKDEA